MPKAMWLATVSVALVMVSVAAMGRSFKPCEVWWPLVAVLAAWLAGYFWSKGEGR